MPDDQSDLKRLRAITPPTVLPPASADSRARSALRDAANAGPHPGRRRQRSSRTGRRRIAIVIGLAAAAATGIAATWLNFESPTVTTGTLCAMYVSRTPSTIQVPTSATPYAAQCTRAWSDWRPGDRATPDQFTACQGNGAIYVYHARPDVCSHLEMPAAPDSPGATDRQVIAFMNATARRVGAAGCVPLADARQIVDDELDDAGLQGWQTLEGTPRSSDERCATLAFDSATRTVALTPMRPQDVSP